MECLPFINSSLQLQVKIDERAYVNLHLHSDLYYTEPTMSQKFYLGAPIFMSLYYHPLVLEICNIKGLKLEV